MYGMRRPNKKPIKLLLVEDHELVRAGVRRMLESSDDFNVVAECSNGEDAIKLARRLNPHVILMDVKMPGMGGLEATLRLREICPHIRILVLTACDDANFVWHFLRAGAYGYVTKSVDYEELTHAICSVYKGRRYLTGDIASQLALRAIDPNKRKGSGFHLLTEREWHVCTALIQGMVVRDIAELFHLARKTVNEHRQHIFKKLNVANDVQLIHLALERGLLKTLID